MTTMRCAFCGRGNDAHESISRPESPRPGDASICWKCRNVSIFTEDGTRKPTPEEQAGIDNHPGIQQTLQLARLAHRPSEVVAMARELATDQGEDE